MANGVALSLPSYVVKSIQQNYLQRLFLDALKPRMRFRREVSRERLPIEAGQTITQTRRGIIQPNLAPMVPGNDPSLVEYSIEQFTTTIRQYADSKATHLPTSAVMITNKFREDLQSLAELSGWKADRLVRAALILPYAGGNTYSTATFTSTKNVHVAALNGFRFKSDTDGKQQPVSSTNALAIKVATTAVNVVGVQPDESDWPDGPGTLLLDTAVSGTGRVHIVALNRPFISFPAGVTGIDDLDSTKIATFTQLTVCKQAMKDNWIPEFEDGTYHMHLCPGHEQELLNDASFQRLYQAAGGTQNTPYGMGVFVKELGITFIVNNDMPGIDPSSGKPRNISLVLGLSNGSTTPGYVGTGGDTATGATGVKELGMEVSNGAAPSLPVLTSIILGRDTIREFYIPEMEYQAQMDGVPNNTVGFQGNFIANGGFEADMFGIRYVLRPPIDPLMQNVLQSYSFSMGWTAPSDEKSTTSAARFKRAILFISA